MPLDQTTAANDSPFIDGEDAGRLLLSPGLNPHEEGTAAHERWRQGHGRGTASRFVDVRQVRERGARS